MAALGNWETNWKDEISATLLLGSDEECRHRFSDRGSLFCGKISFHRRDAQRFALRVKLTRGRVGCHPRSADIDLVTWH
jgi:hypothetical protein